MYVHGDALARGRAAAQAQALRQVKSFLRLARACIRRAMLCGDELERVHVHEGLDDKEKVINMCRAHKMEMVRVFFYHMATLLNII